MLYHPPSSTHPPPHKYQDALPLRIPQETLNRFVEERPIRCTHFDAFRFFTKDARPLNVYDDDLSLGRLHGQALHEQPGCLHANMDLFKWAVKLGPYAPSDLLEETLALAVACRVVDMRASPYDLTALKVVGAGAGEQQQQQQQQVIGGGGAEQQQQQQQLEGGYAFPVSPIKIETEEGRREYQAEQQVLFERAQPLRARLIRVYDLFFRAYEAGREGGSGGNGVKK